MKFGNHVDENIDDEEEFIEEETFEENENDGKLNLVEVSKDQMFLCCHSKVDELINMAKIVSDTCKSCGSDISYNKKVFGTSLCVKWVREL